MPLETVVEERYAAAARRTQDALCCPVDYDPHFLEIIPQEVIERDYGCGDPSRWVQKGDTVLYLGSGTGKICFIAAQVVGPKGRVIGVDMTDEMLDEIFRVLRLGGRAVISDIVSDEPVPEEMQCDLALWSGCISGALTETAFLEAFERAGFHGIELVKRDEQPWRTVQGIEFRSLTVRAFKGKPGPCFERKRAVIYKGPFREVVDDDGHRLRRGDRRAWRSARHPGGAVENRRREAAGLAGDAADRRRDRLAGLSRPPTRGTMNT
ncbi:MAG: methyltransferase domain-containing protein, partial [Verrucomicrobia bacterium]|nr:methyltransferase domain-containing protein [Verrucomicrobiota bacterium]